LVTLSGRLVSRKHRDDQCRRQGDDDDPDDTDDGLQPPCPPAGLPLFDLTSANLFLLDKAATGKEVEPMSSSIFALSIWRVLVSL
jgi:hypothetical protein